ncbi:fungal-specific transcription factor domain-containing protein [Mariannaea sp. PMI_226]|nr:fungal-specific transcription factor domain-containing protein [Mariannaea sp. PMI_226]
MSARVNRSCETCSRRKVRCDKGVPCSNCLKAKIKCSYQAPAPSRRHRKRFADADLLSKIEDYEKLMRRHNIKFDPLDDQWISSPLQDKLPPAGNPSAIAQAPTSSETNVQQIEPSASSTVTTQVTEPPLWLGLPKHLREPPIGQFKRHRNDVIEETPLFSLDIEALPLLPMQISSAPSLLELHPEPRHIFKLWKTFAENVHPLSMIVHAPTLQHRITEVSWNLEATTKPLEAVMFVIYALAITCLKSADCVEIFGEAKSVLLNRFSTGATRALNAASLPTTRDLEVLQALVLFTLLDGRSDAAVTYIGIAVRLGHKMGLHRTGSEPQMPFFEVEMRIRLWWKIRCLELRARRSALGLPPPSRADFGDIRLPLNVNDAELHPLMAAPPSIEHTGATEMLFCLMKYEPINGIRSSPALAEYFLNPVEMIRSTSSQGIATKRKALADLRHIYEDKYLCHCDLSIPLHHLAATSGRLSIYRTIFWCLHPRNQPKGGRLMSQAEQDEIFESSVKVSQLGRELRSTQFSACLLETPAAKSQVDALVYMLSELRHRVSGDHVHTAWCVVEAMYEDYPELLHDSGKFYTGLSELVLEAWDARRCELQRHGNETVPGIIGLLQETRHPNKNSNGGTNLISGSLGEGGVRPEALPDDDTMNWMYWNEFLEV